MRRFSRRRPHIAGKPLTDRTTQRHLLKLADLIFTRRANPTPGVCVCVCVCECACVCVTCVWQLHFIVDGHKQIYGGAR